MKLPRYVQVIIGLQILIGIAIAGYLTRQTWYAWLVLEKPKEPDAHSTEVGTPADRVLLSERAQANLALSVKQLKPTTHWRSIEVPGMVVDRPGRSDRSVVAPVAGIIQAIGYFPGDTVRPGDKLLTLTLQSDAIQLAQTELFKAAQDVKLTRAQRDRFTGTGNVVPEARLIELDNQIARFETAVRAYRQELSTRGLTPEQIAGVVEGRFVTEISIVVPNYSEHRRTSAAANPEPTVAASIKPQPIVEVQELKVELGQHVQAGQTLCTLANHQALYIEGRAFRDETPFLERAVKEGWPVEVDLQEPAGTDWPNLTLALPIEQLSNTIDPVNRTFAFMLPLENQWRTVERNGRSIRLWRFRPGQKVRLHVPIEKMENVFVLPADAVVQDGAEWCVFTQNVNTFVRRPVRVLQRERTRIVIANDGSLAPGSFVVQNAAVQLNRMVKAQAGAAPKGFHVHADGTMHRNED